MDFDSATGAANGSRGAPERRLRAAGTVGVPVPAEREGEPHRALVQAALSSSRSHREWLAEGGPVPQLPADWGSLWAAAVRRQVELTDQSEAAANSAVGCLVDQLSRLQQEAGWFRDDAALRGRAIAETLLWTTGLSGAVPSRAAQEFWQERHYCDPPTDPPGIERWVAVGDRWIEAWHAWALACRQR